MHEDHRKRVKERFLKDGIENMPEHEILEMLLFFSISRKDTNEIAHNLIEFFGSFNDVLEADAADLTKVDGIGEHSAVLITLVFQITKKYLQNVAQAKNKYYTGAESVRDLLRSKYLGAKEERAYLISLDAMGKILNCSQLSKGSFSTTAIDRRHILETIFRNKASSVVLVHNHVNGVAAPSFADVQATKNIVSSFFGMNIRLVDHLIYTDSEIFSMSKVEKYAALFV